MSAEADGSTGLGDEENLRASTNRLDRSIIGLIGQNLKIRGAAGALEKGVQPQIRVGQPGQVEAVGIEMRFVVPFGLPTGRGELLI